MDFDDKADEESPSDNKNSKGTKKQSHLKKGDNRTSGDEVLLIKQKQTANWSTQYSPKAAGPKVKTKEIGVSVSNTAVAVNKKTSSVSVGWETEITMKSKELTGLLSNGQSDVKQKKSSNNSGKINRSRIEEFQDSEIAHYDLKDYK